MPEHTTSSTNSTWETVNFRVDHYVVPTANVRIRFSAADGDFSVTEAGIDNFQVEQFICSSPCVADLDDNGTVGILDLLTLRVNWGLCG